MDLFSVIAEMSGEGQHFVIPRLYVEITGGHLEALVFKQLVFWSNKTKRTDGYFYKKSAELEAETLLTRRQIDGIVKKLEKKQLIEVVLKKASGSPTRHFKILQENVMQSLHEIVQKRTENGAAAGLHETVQSNAPNGANLGLHETVQSITDSNNRQLTTDRVVNEPKKPEINVFTEYEKRWGIIPSAAIQSLNVYLDEGFDPALIVAMMDYAVKKGKRLNYGTGTLDRLHDEQGIKTLEAYEALKQQKRANNVHPFNREGGTDNAAYREQSGIQKNDGGNQPPRDYLAEERKRRAENGGGYRTNHLESDF